MTLQGTTMQSWSNSAAAQPQVPALLQVAMCGIDFPKPNKDLSALLHVSMPVDDVELGARSPISMI
jgi:hypothetical protein